MVLCTNDPDNHVVCAVSRSGERGATTAARPGYIPAAREIDSRRIGCSNAESRQDSIAVIVSAKRDIGALIGPIGHGCLKNRTTGNQRG